MKKALGIDVGASGIKGAIVDLEKGEFITERYRLETPEPKNPENMIKTIKKVVDFFEWKDSIGVGFPSVIKNGVVKTASNISKDWIGINGRFEIEKVTGCPTTLLNDADAAGYAEYSFGLAKGHNGKIVIITIGSGLGSALIYKGQLIPNTEFGQLELKKMKAEHYASDATRKRENLTWAKWGKRFNKFLSLVDRSVCPDIILLGGGSSKHFDKFEPYIDVRAQVAAAHLENKAGIIGAAMMSKL